jgi:hypothetical protein
MADCRKRNGFTVAISPRSATIQKQKNRLGPEIWPIYGRLLTLFPLKRPVRRKKIPPIWRQPP